MDLRAEKRTLFVLAGVAALVLLLIPLAFRELEPDYQAAYSMDAAKKKRFASKDEAAPVLPNLPPSEAPAAAAAAAAKSDTSVHRAPPAVGRARIATPDTPEASSAPGLPDGGASRAGGPPRLKPVEGAGGFVGGRPAGGQALADQRGEGLQDVKFGTIETAPAPKLTLTPGQAEAARVAKSMGLGDVAGMVAAASGMSASQEDCVKASRELKPKLSAAGAAHKSAADALEASGCAKDACGRYADDCQIRDRSPEEAKVAARRCRCDRLACRKSETCRELDRLMCEQKTACSNGAAVSCVGSCD